MELVKQLLETIERLEKRLGDAECESVMARDLAEKLQERVEQLEMANRLIVEPLKEDVEKIIENMEESK